MAEVTLRIENMHCGSCIRRVSQSLASIPGLQVKEVRVGADQAVAALAKAGYPARLEE